MDLVDFFDFGCGCIKWDECKLGYLLFISFGLWDLYGILLLLQWIGFIVVIDYFFV